MPRFDSFFVEAVKSDNLKSNLEALTNQSLTIDFQDGNFKEILNNWLNDFETLLLSFDLQNNVLDKEILAQALPSSLDDPDIRSALFYRALFINSQYFNLFMDAIEIRYSTPIDFLPSR